MTALLVWEVLHPTPTPKQIPFSWRQVLQEAYSHKRAQASWVRILALLLAASTQLCVCALVSSSRKWGSQDIVPKTVALYSCNLPCVSLPWVSGWQCDSVVGSEHHSLPDKHGHATQRSPHYWEHPQVWLMFSPHNLLFWSGSQRETHHQKLPGISAKTSAWCSEARGRFCLD